MWSYWDLVVAQEQADHIQAAGYQASQAAKRKATEEAITCYLDQQCQRGKEREEKKAARGTARANVARIVKAIFRRHGAVAR